MSYIVINGTFHIVSANCGSGPQPDGDTLKFKATDPLLIETLNTTKSTCPAYNTSQQVNIRFEAIDALETHFENKHQDLSWARSARDRMLELAGYEDVVFCPDKEFNIQSAKHDPLPGHILAKGLDSHGRIIAFVYKGDSSQPDGSKVEMSDTLLRSSINYKLLELGLVYPAFYKSLPSNLRSALRNTSRSAQRNNTGLWPEAACLTGKIATIPDFPTLQQLVLWPKLFRRLTSYFSAGHMGLSNFLKWMKEPRFQKERNDFFLLPDGSVGNFTDIIEVHGDTLSVRYDSDDVTIVPDGVSPTDVDDTQPATKPIVRILSLMPAPVKGIKENICILNTTPFTVNIDGWTFCDLKDNTDNLAGNLVSGEIRQIEADAITLNNSGDEIFLKNSQGEIIDQVKYYGSQAECKGRTIVLVRIGERSLTGY